MYDAAVLQTDALRTRAHVTIKTLFSVDIGQRSGRPSQGKGTSEGSQRLSLLLA